MKIDVGSEIECVAHDGSHKGTIQHVLGPGIYAVSWNALAMDAPWSVKTNFARNHIEDIGLTRSTVIRERSQS